MRAITIGSSRKPQAEWRKQRSARLVFQKGPDHDRAQGKVDGMIEVLVDAWAAAAEDDQRRELLGEVITDIDNNREGIQNDCFCLFPPDYSGVHVTAVTHGIIVERDFQLRRRSDRQCHNF